MTHDANTEQGGCRPGDQESRGEERLASRAFVSEVSPGEVFDAEFRENQLVAMAEAGQKLAVQWGHRPWSDSWARLVAETLDNAAANANHWRCECGDANGLYEAFCYRCGACQPEDDDV